MKKLLFALMALAVGMTACQDKNKPEEPKPEEVTYKLTITPSELSLYADESATLKLTLTPEVQNVEYKFTTDDEDIATVSAKGHVTAGSKYGEATITVRASIDGEEVARARCYVEVVKDKVILSKEEVTLVEGKSTTLTAKLDKAGTTITSSCTWKSSDDKVATVSGGTIKAVAGGECDITATYDGVTGTCHVIVTPILKITPATANILAGETLQLTANIPGCTFSSSNTSVATVSIDGFVTGVKSGTATITAKSEDETATAKVTISSDLRILLNGNAVSTICLCESGIQLTTNASGQVEWSSSNTSAVTINSNGYLTKIGTGVATITAKVGQHKSTVSVDAFFGFSSGQNAYIRFAPGNLQYQASTNTFRFAPNQYVAIGEDNKYISSTYSGWIDLFGWGTGDNPTFYGSPASYYSTYYSPFTDWGTNAIKNGSTTDPAGTWRTPTFDEIYYIIRARTNAANLIGAGQIDGTTMVGIIILPDDWTLPTGLKFSPSNFDDYSKNSYTTTEWSKMEANGAVFLPNTGRREGTKVSYCTICYYWTQTISEKSEYSSTCYGYDPYDSYYKIYLYPGATTEWNNGMAVRLVR